jgi:hypothetical protein
MSYRTFISRACCALLLTIGLVLTCAQARADLTIVGLATPTGLMLQHWYSSELPPCFSAKDDIALYPLEDPGMDNYLKSIGLSDGTSYSKSDAGEIDGLFVNRQKRISVRVDSNGGVDMETLSHEYGHYVWFHLFTNSERQQYRDIYKHQSRDKQLVTDYAATNLEEGFAEAFAFFVVDPLKLDAADPVSYQFLLDCITRRTEANEASAPVGVLTSDAMDVSAPSVQGRTVAEINNAVSSDQATDQTNDSVCDIALALRPLQLL